MSFDPATRARLVGLFVAEADETVVALRGLEGAVASFAAVLRSHFTYEEDELSEPLGLLGII